MRSPQTYQERLTVARWAAQAFRPQALAQNVQFWMEILPREPGYHPGRQLVVESQGELVSHLRIVDRAMQVGLGKLRMGGICALVTPPEQRGHGYASALMQHTVQRLAQQGFDLSCLNGIRDFYQRFGYASVMPYHNVRVQTQEALALASPLAVRPLSSSDVPALADLYDRCWSNRVGALERDEALWRWTLDSGRQGDVAVGADGRVRGYAIYANEANRAVETAASDANAIAALLRRLAQRAQEAGQDDIYVQRPSDALFARLARTMCALETIERSCPGAGWQARILNIKALFAKLSPELSDRLARSPLAGWSGCLRLETEIGGVSLLIERNKVQVDERARVNLICLMPQSRLAQLLFGYITVAEAAVAPGSNIPYTASPLMAALFPPTVASIAGLDWF